MVGVFESEAEDKNGEGHDGGGEPDDNEARFGLDVTRMPAQVEVADEVVQPVAQNCSDDGADYGGEVEEAWMRVRLGVGFSSFTRGKGGCRRVCTYPGCMV